MTAQELYRALVQYYGTPCWWSENPYQVMLESILVQHTTWNSVKKLRPLFENNLSPFFFYNMEQEALEELIRPCGFQTAKAKTIKAVTEWFLQYQCDQSAVRKQPFDQLRKELLSVRSIGAETADVILVYAFYQPTFIVDAYTRLFLKRLGYSFENDVQIKTFFQNEFRSEYLYYGNIHWLILKHCIAHCKKTPLCIDCLFWKNCNPTC